LSKDNFEGEDNYTEKNYANLSNARVDAGFDIIDFAMEEVINAHHLNYYEVLTILAMMGAKVHRNNIDQYLIETVTRFQQKMNKEDEEGK